MFSFDATIDFKDDQRQGLKVEEVMMGEVTMIGNSEKDKFVGNFTFVSRDVDYMLNTDTDHRVQYIYKFSLICTKISGIWQFIASGIRE